jgi:hypothetical protein
MYPFMTKGRLPGRDRMVVGFTATCAISVLSDPTSLLSGEATNINFIVFGLTSSGLGSTIYRTRGEHGNHYTSDMRFYDY